MKTNKLPKKIFTGGRKYMKIGKLPNEVLKDVIISKIGKINDDIIVGPEIGEDCSIIKFNDDVCVLTTDPITAAANDAGSIGVHICCNDIASAGVRPLGVLVTLLAPPSSDISEIAKIMEDVNKACSELHIDVLGGHTEITDAVNRIVLSLTAIGKGRADSFVKTGGAHVDDDIVVTGYVGLEGTAIISKDYYEYLKGLIDEEIILRGQNLLESISVVKTGLLSSEYGVHAMHDATEGGILGAVWELAEAAGMGLRIYADSLPLKEETKIICSAVKIDPLRLISSGCMVIAVKNGEGLCDLLKANGINACVAGKITLRDKKIIYADGEYDIAPPESDEIYNIKID
jgi:hydrogenase maturation factor